MRVAGWISLEGGEVGPTACVSERRVFGGSFVEGIARCQHRPWQTHPNSRASTCCERVMCSLPTSPLYLIASSEAQPQLVWTLQLSVFAKFVANRIAERRAIVVAEWSRRTSGEQGAVQRNRCWAFSSCKELIQDHVPATRCCVDLLG